MILNAPAKINIGLKIINKREDGFHNLETIFYPVRLFDEVSLKIYPSVRNTNSVIIRSSNKVIPTDRNNICFKVIENFFRTFKISAFYSIDIFIKKNIPVGGGLGGGSSNAASILKYLIKYFKINVEACRKDILKIALSVGSDVPFFLISKPCFAQSRGEIITKLDKFLLNDYKILLVNPNLHVSTKWAFESLGIQPGQSNISELKNVKEFNLNNLSLLVNDFEDVVFKKYSELGKIKNELIDFGAEYSSMSGSGATMFGLFKKDNPDSVQKAYNFYLAKNYFVFIS
jgi:4-diphosphocytidyl-2-C-methyl-D-erythritol kinase